MKMKRKICASIMFLLIILVARTGASQEEIITLNLNESAKSTRPLVLFPHEQHADDIVCTRCHHDFDEFGANIGNEDEGQSCSECHTNEASNPIPLLKAFHLQCKGCHMRKTNTGPVMCGQCHIR
jgi:hypothetical protein